MLSASARCLRILKKPLSTDAKVQQPARLQRNKPPLVTSPSYYWDTTAPSLEQLKRAHRFFWQAAPRLLYSSTQFRNVQFTGLPEVAFLGRSNVGKSSLLNALMGKEICHVSSKAGRTRSMNFFAVGGEDGRGNPGKLAVLDMPGYGKGSREEWGPEIMKYLVGRKELRRAFLLVDALHGLKRSDEELLSMFRQHAISHQVILSKVDRVLFGKSAPSLARIERNSPQLEAIVADLKTKIQPGNGDGPEALGEILTCSGDKTINGTKLGVNNVRWGILVATGLSEEMRQLMPSDIVPEGAIPNDIKLGKEAPVNARSGEYGA